MADVRRAPELAPLGRKMFFLPEDDLRNSAKSVSHYVFHQYFDHLHDRADCELKIGLLPRAAQGINQGAGGDFSERKGR